MFWFYFKFKNVFIIFMLYLIFVHFKRNIIKIIESFTLIFSWINFVIIINFRFFNYFILFDNQRFRSLLWMFRIWMIFSLDFWEVFLLLGMNFFWLFTKRKIII
jgi:hypothetical protein